MRDSDGAAEGAYERDQRAAARHAAANDRDGLHAERHKLADEREARADAAEAGVSQAFKTHAEALEAHASQRASNRTSRDAHDDRHGHSAWQRPDTATDWDAAKRDFVDDDRESWADAREALWDERDRLADEREALLQAVIADTAAHVSALTGLDAEADRVARHEAAAQRIAAAAARAETANRRLSEGPNSLVNELLHVALHLYRSNDVRQAMADIVNTAPNVIEGSESSSISIRDGDGYATVAASSDLANSHDQVQYAAGEGPCIQALNTSRVVVAGDLRGDDRWPSFAASIATMDARSAVSAPLAYEAETSRGALNNYSTTVSGFDDDDVELAQLLAAHLAILVDWSGSVSEARAKSMELQKAIETRDVIGQAKGILMERDRLTADEAFDVLSRASQRLNRKLRDIADELTTTGTISHD